MSVAQISNSWCVGTPLTEKSENRMVSAKLSTLANILDRSIRARLLGESVVEDERTRVGIIVTALRITGTVAIGWNTHCFTIEGGTGP